MEPLILFIILFLAIAGMGTIWYIGTQSTCKLPDNNTCKSASQNGRLQIPFCDDNTEKPNCVDDITVCKETIPVDCDNPYCDWNDTKKWKCKKGPKMYSCINNSCALDSNGTLTYEQCSSTCNSSSNCNVDSNGNLPYPLSDGKNIYTKLIKADKYGIYKYITIGTENACQLTSCTSGTLKEGVWCDPDDDGTECPTTLKDTFPNEPYKGIFRDINAKYVITYMNYDNTKPYCKFSQCQSGFGGNPCVSSSCPKDNTVFSWTSDCKVDKCINGYSPNDGNTSCVKNNCSSSDPWSILDPDTCKITSCKNNGITNYTPNPDGSKCIATSCADDTIFKYTPNSEQSVCVISGCVPDSDPRKQYNPDNNCNAICTGDSCNAFLGIPEDYSGGYQFSCDSNGRTCKPHDDGTNWHGCGDDTHTQYGPSNNGNSCEETIFQQRSRFVDGVGCITCLPASGSDCSPWQTEKTKCSWANGCTYGEDDYSSSLQACVSSQSDIHDYYSFEDNIENYKDSTGKETGEQIRRLSKTITFSPDNNADGFAMFANDQESSEKHFNQMYPFTFTNNSDYILIISHVVNTDGQYYEKSYPCWYVKTDVLYDYMVSIQANKVFCRVASGSTNDYIKLINMVFDDSKSTQLKQVDAKKFITCCNTGTNSSSDDPNTKSFPLDGKCTQIKVNCKWW